MKEQHKTLSKATPILLFEGIKSVMKAYQWGYPSLSAETSYINEYQIDILLSYGFSDITIAFDSDVPVKKILECVKTLKHFTNVHILHDRISTKGKLLGVKDAPVDRGREVFETLLSERRRVN